MGAGLNAAGALSCMEPILSVGLSHLAHRTMPHPSWNTHTGRGPIFLALRGQHEHQTLLIIVVLLLVLGGGGFYARGRWY